MSRLDRQKRITYVVLPANGIECDRVNILVEDQRHGDREVEDVETLCTDREWQDLDGVRNDEWGERKTVFDQYSYEAIRRLGTHS